MNSEYPQRQVRLPVITVLDDQAAINLNGAVSENIGILIYDGSLAPLIQRGEPYPCIKSFTFSTYVDNQSAIELRFFRGNQPAAADNKCLGRLEMRGFRLMPAKQPLVRLFIRACENRIEAWAEDAVDGFRINITVDKEGDYIPPTDSVQRLKNAEFALKEFALVNYGPQTVEVPTNLFSAGNILPRRQRWSVEIEELSLTSSSGSFQNTPVRGAVLDLLTSPGLLVQVTLRGTNEYLIELLAERAELSTPTSVRYSLMGSKIVVDNSFYVIERSLMDLVAHGILPRVLP